MAEYFSAKRSGLPRDCSLAELGVKTVEPAAVQQLLPKDPERLASQKRALFERHRTQYPTWARELRGGANICLYGWGSKRDLLLEFAGLHLIPQGGCVIAIDGLKPGVTARAILLHAAAAHIHGNVDSRNLPQLALSLRSKSDDQLLRQVADFNSPLSVLLHNIDGPSELLNLSGPLCPLLHCAFFNNT